MATNLFRNLPSVNELLESPPLKGMVAKVSHHVVVTRVRSFLDDLRSELQSAAGEVKLPDVRELAERIAARIVESDKPLLCPVINATGVLLHTGLGRAPLAEAAIAEVAAVAQDYASVELDLASGHRSQRVLAVEGLLAEATGAEAAAVFNNNAAATMLTLAALAAGREVIVSRGQLIEIGGSYRLPEVMTVSGAVLREVGTTNKTRLEDYERAVCGQSAALLLVHPSNYVVSGFVKSVSLADLVRLGRAKSLPVIHDVGSGALIDFARFGFSDEPVVGESVKQGADLVLFSGDKLLGGPQCGIAVGKRSLVEQLLRHPLARALRVDKITLAALAATLRLYRNQEQAMHAVPLLHLLSTPLENLRIRAQRLAPQMADCRAIASADPLEDVAFLGGGSLPTQKLATWCVALTPSEMSVDRLAMRLRTGKPAVVGRVHEGRLYLDLRTVFPRQDLDLVAAVRALADGEAL